LKSNEPKPANEFQQFKMDQAREQKQLATQGQLATFDTMLETLDRVKNHQGLPRATGKMAYVPSVKGTDAYNFEQEFETLKSQAFIPMVASLKGMGSLSDAEGKKLTAAVGALDAGMDEKELKKSIERIYNDISAAKTRIQSVTGITKDGEQSTQQPQTQQAQGKPPAGYEEMVDAAGNPAINPKTGKIIYVRVK
jgi:hypothetical protein